MLSAFRADRLRRRLTFYTQTVCAEKSGAKVLLTYWFRLVDSMGENSEPALKLQISVRVLVSFTVLISGWHMVAYSLPPAP